MRIAFRILFLWILSTSVGQAASQQGGFAQLPLGSRVQGSVDHGGMQPNYDLSADDPELKSFLAKVHTAIQSKSFRSLFIKGKWYEVAQITRLVQVTMKIKEYDSEDYLQILKQHRDLGKDIQLGAYIRCGSGVCRENALLTHLALNEAQIENYHVYATVHMKGSSPEDHAFVVVPDGEHRWIVDPYNSYFHGKDLNEILVTQENTGEVRSKAPFVLLKPNDKAKVLKVNDYPTYWIPSKCESLF